MRLTSAVCVAALSLSLAACQSLLSPFGLAKGPRTNSAVTADLAKDYFQQRFLQGRLALHEGNLAQAIDAFSQAAVLPELKPGALNGLAVAYAKLGRDDLARRYFAEAIAADPTDQRFAANLARLDAKLSPRSEQPMLALNQSEGQRPVVIHLPSFETPSPEETIQRSQESVRPSRRAIASGVWVEPEPSERKLAGGVIRITLPPSHPVRLSDGEILVGSKAVSIARQADEDSDAYPIRIALKNVPRSQ